MNRPELIKITDSSADRAIIRKEVSDCNSSRQDFRAEPVCVEDISIYDEAQAFREFEAKLDNCSNTLLEESKFKKDKKEPKPWEFRDINLFKRSITGTAAPFMSGEHGNLISNARERVAL